LNPASRFRTVQNFDPTKAGYSSISFGGRFGRTARIEVDGADVSDETVGTTTTDIPSSAIQEFQISQSSLDMSTELTSSGSVNVTTKAGTNNYHGESFGQSRDSVIGAPLPTPPGINAPYQRSQYGGDLGGPILRDRLFFFVDGERTIQHTNAPVPVSVPFSQYSGTFSDPFHEGNLLGRVDYQWGGGVHLFYRFSYFKNSLDATSGAGYSQYDTKNNTRDHVVGVDFKTGNFIHSIRFSFLKFQNEIVDATVGDSALPLNNLGAQIIMGSTGLAAGPTFLAPQTTAQSDHEFKYDVTKIAGSHVIRYGVAFNHIQGAVFAPLLKYGPQIVSTVSTIEVADAAGGPFPGGSSNPLNYPADSITITNGLGYFTSEPALGFQAGGLGPDNRVMTYLGDSCKIKPNFNLTYGLRWDRDTGRTDNQYAGLPELNALLPGLNLGNRVLQPNFNFAPRWDLPGTHGKTAKLLSAVASDCSTKMPSGTMLFLMLRIVKPQERLNYSRALLRPWNASQDSDSRWLSHTELRHSRFSLRHVDRRFSDWQRAPGNCGITADLSGGLAAKPPSAKSVVCGTAPYGLQHRGS
jgi:hypothetical protein